MLPNGILQIWADTLTHKHECGPERAIRATICSDLELNPVDVWMPDFLDEPQSIEFRAYLKFGDLLILVTRYGGGDNEYDEPRCFLMMARKSEDGSFLCHVWHELFSFTLERLGLAERTIPGAIHAEVHAAEGSDDEHES